MMQVIVRKVWAFRENLSMRRTSIQLDKDKRIW